MTLLDDIPMQRPRPLRTSLGMLFSAPPFAFLLVTTSLSLLLLYIVLFQIATTFEVFFLSNTLFYIAASIVLTLLIALLGGLSITQSLFIFSVQIAKRRGQGAAQSFVGTGIGALAAGCPSCASLLLPALGIAGSLAAFPLGGLEIKLIALLILVDVIWENGQRISGVCPVDQPKLVRLEEDTIVFDFSFGALRRLKSAALIVLGILIIYLLPLVPAQYRVSFASESAPTVVNGRAPQQSTDTAALVAEINPEDGYSLPYTYGDIGPKLIEAGAFDLDQFAELYSSRGAPLSAEQIRLLEEGSDQPITINRENANFLLNLFWALGLTNANPILDSGPLVQNSQGNITTFASTGGWTLATKPIPELYASTQILMLTVEQQAWVEEAAANTYRPCCNNSTLFADCNHGMAMLGLFELMASQGAGLDQMYEAAKYFNAFWFPQQTYELAVYFEATEGKHFAEIDGRTLVGAEYSSGRGWSAVHQALVQNGRIQQVPGGGGCGV